MQSNCNPVWSVRDAVNGDQFRFVNLLRGAKTNLTLRPGCKIRNVREGYLHELSHNVVSLEFEERPAFVLCTCKALYNLVSRGQIPKIKVGGKICFAPDDLKAFADANRQCENVESVKIR